MVPKSARPTRPALLLLALAAGAAAAAAASTASGALAGRSLSQAALPDAGSAAVGAGIGAVYFPLLSSNLASAWTPPGVGPFVGVGVNVEWAPDPAFGEVLDCSEARQSHVAIPGLKYGQGGGFGMAIWAKLSPQGNSTRQPSMEYIYSHTSTIVKDWAFDPNEAGLFVPELFHPAFGVVRAMVRDSTDTRTNGTDLPMWLDSNGCVSDPKCAAPSQASLFSTEGAWHLLGLSTRPEGGKGFSLYIDGEEVASVKEGEVYRDGDGFSKTATAGAPMDLTGELTLCSRSDLDPERYFTGRLAHLFVWNSSVSPDEMRLIYQRGPEVQPADAAGIGAAAAPTPTAPEGPSNCTTPCQDFGAGLLMCRTGQGVLVLCPGSLVVQPGGPQAATQPAPDCTPGCTEVQGVAICFTSDDQPRACQGSATAAPPAGNPAEAPATGAAPVAVPPASGTAGAAQLQGHPLCSAAPLEGIATVLDCGQGYACAALSQEALVQHPQLSAGLPLQVGDIGVCAYSPSDIMLPGPPEVPPPMAFFPLSSQTLESFPLPDFSAVSSASVGIVEDPLFGAVLQCTGDDKDMVGLDPVQYARTGAFSVNLWFRPGDMSGGGAVSYLFSHRGTDPGAATSNATWGPNQIQIYLPRERNPAYGVVRAYVKDFNDQNTTEASLTWLDSDGSIAVDSGPRTIPPSASLYDGAWHMVTVTSQPGGAAAPRKGYRLYLDGKLVNQISADVLAFLPPDRGGLPIPVDGGDAMLLDGNPVLCSRSDDPTNRHYDGQLAQLALFDAALDEVQVRSLYNEVAAKMAALPAPAPIAAGAASPEMPVIASQDDSVSNGTVSVSGKLCQFPAVWNGEVVNECVEIDGVPQCQVDVEKWEPCFTLVTGQAGAAPLPPAAQAFFAPTATGLRSTLRGEECQFPAYYDGQQISDCVAFEAGGPEMCQIASGAWDECAPQVALDGQRPSAVPAIVPLLPDAEPGSAPDSTSNATVPGSLADISGQAPILSASNGLCQLPLTHNGMRVDSCVSIHSSYLCWEEVTASWQDCAEDFATEQPQPGLLGLGPAAIALPVVPWRSRKTVAGDECYLPTVNEGEVLDDCVSRNGTWSCLVGDGSWRTCAFGSDPPPAEEQGLVMVAQRETVSGQPCLLPAVSNGRLFFDCVHAPSPNGTFTEMCPTQGAEWERCVYAQQAADYVEPVPFNTDQLLARTAPGRLGMLCMVGPSADQPAAGCVKNLACVPLPDLNGDALSSLDGVGFCTQPPAGGTMGVLEYLREAGAPTPLAFFPLTGGTASSLLLPAYQGSPSGSPLPGWVSDPVFNTVVNCSRAGSSAVVLDTVPYASQGPFAVSLWMRRLPVSNLTGEFFSYLYSHVEASAKPDPLGLQLPNRVGLYLPNRGNPAYGVVRAIVADANDEGSSLVWIDSDGTVSNSAAHRKPKHADVNDGGWHMISLSTLPQEPEGFALFVDGARVAILSSNSTAADGERVNATGGGPAALSSPIRLCSRFDGDRDRFFDGSIAHLQLFSQALTPDEVSGLYNSYALNSNLSSAGTTNPDVAVGGLYAGEDPASSSGGGLTPAEITGIVLASLGGAIALATIGVLAVGHTRRKIKSKHFERFKDNPAAAAAAEAGAAGGGGAAAVPLPGAAGLTIQLSGGNALSLEGTEDKLVPPYQSALSDVSMMAPYGGASAGVPRLHTTHSGVPLLASGSSGSLPRVPSTASGVPHLPSAHSGLPLLAASSSGGFSGGGARPATRPSATAPDVGTAIALAGGGDEAAGGSGGGSSEMRIEPGKRGLFKTGSARVVLPQVSEGEQAAAPRSPFDP